MHSGKAAMLVRTNSLSLNERHHIKVHSSSAYCRLFPPERDVAPGSAHRPLSTRSPVDAELVIERRHAVCVGYFQRTVDIDLASTRLGVDYGVDANRRTNRVARQRRATVDVVQCARLLDSDQDPTSS